MASRRTRRMISRPSMSGRPRSSRITSGRLGRPALERGPPVRPPPGCGSRAIRARGRAPRASSSSSSTTRTVAPARVYNTGVSGAGQLGGEARQRQVERHGQAAELTPARLGRAAHRAHQAAHDREADPRAGPHRAARSPGRAVEWLEDPLELLVRNARPAILDRRGAPGRRRVVGRDPDGGARRQRTSGRCRGGS